MSNHAPKVDPVAKLLFVGSLLAIVAVVYVLLSSLVNTYQRNSTKGEIDKSQRVMDVANNLQPIGASSTSDAPVVAAAATPARSGKEVFDAICMACHATGVADAPKLTDKAAWEPRVATGLDALMTTAINGKGAMPARGGNPSVTDAELKATILYMTKAAGFDLGTAEPVKSAETPKQEESSKEEAPKAVEAPKTEEQSIADVIPTAASVPEAPAAPAVVEAPAALEVAAAPVAAAPAASEDGKKVYDTTCFACHATGVAGSPKLGDKVAWAPRIATGMDALYATSLNGKGAMPPKGGNMALEDDKVKAAVDYMVNAAK